MCRKKKKSIRLGAAVVFFDTFNFNFNFRRVGAFVICPLVLSFFAAKKKNEPASEQN